MEIGSRRRKLVQDEVDMVKHACEKDSKCPFHSQSNLYLQICAAHLGFFFVCLMVLVIWYRIVIYVKTI